METRWKQLPKYDLELTLKGIQISYLHSMACLVLNGNQDLNGEFQYFVECVREIGNAPNGPISITFGARPV